MARFRRSAGWLGLLGLLLLTRATEAAEAVRIAPFALPDCYGRERSLAEFEKSDLVVVAFLGTECPLARLYASRLQELNDEYAQRGVAFVGIDANAQDSLTDLANYARQYGIGFPLLTDRDQSVADAFGAERTPEVFLLDRQRAIRYRGRIDDQYGLGSSSGYARTEVGERSLGQAIDELLAGKEVSQPRTLALGCLIGRTPKTEPKGEITFTKHIARILNDRCVICHREGQIGPFALTEYDEVVGWAPMLREVVSEGRMPPWLANPEFGHYANDARLADDEKQTLFAWIDNGCPQGDPADAPAARLFADGWMIPEPDQVFTMPQPFAVPAEGVINYQNFSVDTGWTEDKYIQFVEARPGNRGVVHHIIVNVSAPRTRSAASDENAEANAEPESDGPRRRGRRGSDGLDESALRGGKLTAYTPGRAATAYPPGVALFCPAGSRLTFQMHYTPNGTAGEDQSYVGVVFADPKDVKHVIRWSTATNNRFVIPARADSHLVESEYRFRTDQTLYSMTPHMHVRGKSFRYEAVYPDGTRETLLDVPRWDFNWQLEYELAEPKRMPAGTTLHCTAYYDNSETNAANPNPNEDVRWGSQTWEEMMIGWFCTVVEPAK